MDKKKINIIIPCLLQGGTEIQTLLLARVLIELGNYVDIYCYFESDKQIVNEFKAEGIRVHLLGWQRSLSMFTFIRALTKVLQEKSPDVVHVQYIAPGFLPIIASRMAKVPYIFATVHQPGRVYGWKEKFFLRTAARLCTAFFCNSQSVERSWFGDSEIFDPSKKYKNRKHFTIYNAVDVDHIEQIIKNVDRGKLKKELGIDNKPVIGVVGRLRWEKGQDILLEAMPEVIKAIPNVMLLAVGDGPDRISLEQRAKSLKVGNNILWLGQKTIEEVYRLYSIMDVVVVPSRFEGFGLSAAEAMAVGCPVVASAVDGLEEVVQYGASGLLFPADDSKKLALSIVDLLMNREKALIIGDKGKDDIKNKFSIEKYASSILSAYSRYCK
jgi:glycosyltransferase involved in cell wall biosynthesis